MMQARKYRKKPVVIEAMKYDGYNYPEAQDWIVGKGVIVLLARAVYHILVYAIRLMKKGEQQ